MTEKELAEITYAIGVLEINMGARFVVVGEAIEGCVELCDILSKRICELEKLIDKMEAE